MSGVIGDIILQIIKLIGGLAFFLYGMNLMSSGLKKAAGGKMERILQVFSSTPLKGVLLGTVTTAIIQSSSATTVMVIGFVNSGLMQLGQAIGIVMGANIGTTATSWLLSTSEINSSVFWLKIFQPSSFAPILAAIGAFFVMFSKKKSRKSIGTVLLGFAILMFGITTMSEASAPLADSPRFAEILLLFSNPFLGLLVGAVMTAVIQSSSATVGILQALSLTVPVSYSTAIPLILGMNIGACVPVLISGFGATRDGKRTSLIYLIFNAIGSAIFMVIFYTINWFSPFRFLGLSATPVGIAIFNTFFKLSVTVVLLPFVSKLEKLVCWIIPEGKHAIAEHPDAAQLLDVRFLASPGYAIEQCQTVVNEMAELGISNIKGAVALFHQFDEEQYNLLAEDEERVDEYEDKLGTYLVRLSGKSLNEAQSRSVSKILHAIGDFERLSDHALNMAGTAREIYEKGIDLSGEAQDELKTLVTAVQEILDISVRSFRTNDPELASHVEPLEEVIDLLCEKSKSNHIRRLSAGLCTIENGFIFNDTLTNLERISDHCSNIAVNVIRLNQDVYDTHEYLHELKEKSDGEYARMFREFGEKYHYAD